MCAQHPGKFCLRSPLLGTTSRCLGNMEADQVLKQLVCWKPSNICSLRGEWDILLEVAVAQHHGHVRAELHMVLPSKVCTPQPPQT